MLDIEEFRTLVVRLTISAMDMHSQAAENLLVGTAVQESGRGRLVQKGGPALGIYQMEPATFNDIGAYLIRKDKSVSDDNPMGHRFHEITRKIWLFRVAPSLTPVKKMKNLGWK